MLVFVMGFHIPVSRKHLNLRGLEERFETPASIPAVDPCERFGVVDVYHLRSSTYDRPCMRSISGFRSVREGSVYRISHEAPY